MERKEIIYRKLSDLKKLSNNPRKISQESFDKLCKSIKDNPDYFEARPIILSDRTGELVILAGNQRYDAAKKLGLKKVPTFLLSELSEEKEHEITIRDNVANGEWDYELLEDWDKVKLSDWGVIIPGEYETAHEAKEDDYEISNEIKTDIQYKDLFQIGNHFLICGDATKKEDVEKLLKSQKADMIFSDPPYDLEDNYSQNIFDAAKDDCHIFIMNSDKLLIEIVNNGYKWFRKFFTIDFRQARLISNNQPMTRCDLIAEFCKGKTRFNNLHDGFSTLIECSKIHNDNEKVNFGFNQAKRIELSSTFIRHYTKINEIVVDFFGGSGSTMAACEQLKRNCYMMELEPKHCQIIINRMSEIYNLKAIKLN